ncbi:ESX secretion-associated protein EspG [Saccharopolyspora gregorii]|uniref:ESX secretion-associated protein EspG n=1 Tax=Saccharopolyspora gregorii TaxID=33914 RepID=A0ABP6RX37_9PSEU|nr:ESX secretion-associated protein EspG [Saccharopolyspora gregorii]
MGEADFVLSAVEFDLVSGALDLGRAPYPLRVPSIGATGGERAARTAAAFRALAERGLATGDRLDAELEGLLRLLAVHEISVDVVGHVGGTIRALAAADRRSGVLAVLDGDRLSLRGFRPGALAAVVAGVLPPADPGKGRSLTVRQEVLAKAADEDDPGDDPFGGDLDEHTALVRAGVSEQDAAALVELAENRRGGGQLGVRRGGARARTLISWLDTAQGRYLLIGERGWLSIMPAEPGRVEQRLGKVLSTVDFAELVSR